ncbi:hypothetical protein BV25DRAFT_1916378 [Artomyces pyxidatus]|uniref:Uncharacterized protein n=1 Tax=Artomyces pyxidatus TaxID=48021 RepID=A0ACB8T0U7_9AGAM|nr:hypothetical protein BV25DRAFT_1916378 [Artomyces pyxidatus]
MAFIRNFSDNGLVRDDWPNAIARLAQDIKEYPEMSTQETVPATFESICDWAYVFYRAHRQDLVRSHVLLSKPNTPALNMPEIQCIEEVNIRFQGFLGQHNLKVFGSWNGNSVHNVHKAVQFLEITSGPFKAQMVDQIVCVDNIRRLVIREILPPQDAAATIRLMPPPGESLSFQRRVFKKIQNGSHYPPSVLTAIDDPTGQTASFARQWRVTSKIALGRKVATGKVERCSPLVFSYGDFVDVTARVDIANVTTENDVPTVKVFFAPVTVIQLCKADDVPEFMGVELSDTTELADVSSVTAPTMGVVFDY